jgi:hypothetical protein
MNIFQLKYPYTKNNFQSRLLGCLYFTAFDNIDVM